MLPSDAPTGLNARGHGQAPHRPALPLGAQDSSNQQAIFVGHDPLLPQQPADMHSDHSVGVIAGMGAACGEADSPQGRSCSPRCRVAKGTQAAGLLVLLALALPHVISTILRLSCWSTSP